MYLRLTETAASYAVPLAAHAAMNRRKTLESICIRVRNAIHSRKSDWLEWTVEDAEDYDFPDSWIGKVYFVKCKTPPHCPREMRPFQCRTYPLSPYLSPEGVLELVYNDEELPYSCPLIEDEIPLNGDFVKATYTVWKHLILDPHIYDLVEEDSRARDEA